MPSLPVASPRLADDVVRLRPWGVADVDLRLRAGSDLEILKFTSVPERPTSAEALQWIDSNTKDFARAATACFVVERIDTGAASGSMSLIRISWQELRAEVGYWLLPEHRGAGLTGRALELLSQWSFTDVGLQRLELLTNLDNLSSQRVARTCKYEYEGTLRSYCFGRVGRETLHMFSRLPAD